MGYAKTLLTQIAVLVHQRFVTSAFTWPLFVSHGAWTSLLPMGLGARAEVMAFDL
jgi:hypothetical protein